MQRGSVTFNIVDKQQGVKYVHYMQEEENGVRPPVEPLVAAVQCPVQALFCVVRR